MKVAVLTAVVASMGDDDATDPQVVLEVDQILGLLQDVGVGQPGQSLEARPGAPVPGGLRPGNRNGLRFGLRPGRKSKRVKKMTKKQVSMDRQARHVNASGRARNEDFNVPLHEAGLERPRFDGSGAWKTWSPTAILRAGFSDEKATCRQSAAAIEGAGKDHAAASRLVVADAIMHGQAVALKRLAFSINPAQAQPATLRFAIRNLMFDESSFELSIANRVSASYAVLCSHAQLTYQFAGEAAAVHDEHIVRSPAILSPVMNSATMHAALSAGPGGFSQVLDGNVKYVATLTTSDAHAANIRMLRFVDQELDDNHFFLPSLCLQHRVGNTIEQLTKFLGNLGGNFSIAKVLGKGNLVQALHRSVGHQMVQKLQILRETPAAVLAEWSTAQLQARNLIDLCMSFDDEDPARSGTHREAFQRFANFFTGPWTGLGPWYALQ